MNIPSSPLDLRLTTLLQKVRDEQDDQARSELNALLLTDAAARRAMAVALVNEQVLISHLRDQSIVSILNTDSFPKAAVPKTARWFAWRPLTAAAAGIVFGMLCTSVLFGYVAQRAVQRIPIPVFDPGFEGLKPLDKGLPHGPDEWGARSALIVSAEKGVQPLAGKQMLRLQPALLGKLDEKLYAHAYQVIDLRSLPTEVTSAGRKVQVTASFCKATDGLNPRNCIRLFALNESPDSVTDNFWSKEENEDIVAMAQRFETKAVKSGWHPVSVEMPLPPSAQSLIIIFSANCPKQDAAASYLDDVQVSLLTSENPLP
jgi:hypothetical protein